MTQNKPIRIALTGKLRTGKSTIADHLWLNYDFEKISFATTLRQVAELLFGHMHEYNNESPTGYSKPRALLQTLGQKMREIDEDVWIRQAEQAVLWAEDSRRTAGVVIDDLRQPNEYDWARANGFIIIRVEASEELRLRRAKQAGDSFSEEDLAHDTEQHVEGFSVDYTIINDGDLDDLKRQVDEIMSEIKAKGGRYVGNDKRDYKR